MHELPPNNTGGGLAFADTPQAYDDLDDSTKQYLLATSSQDIPWCTPERGITRIFKDSDPNDYSFGRHKLFQLYENLEG